MMAIYRNIHLTFWTDADVIEDFTPEDKYFYLYLLTNPHTNLLGCYEITYKQMSDETGYSRDTVDKLMKRMISVHSKVEYSESTKEILICNWHKHNWTASDKQYIAIMSQLENVKDVVFKEKLQDRVSIRYPYGMHTTDTDIYSNTNNKDKEEEIKFSNTVKDIIDYLNTVCGTKYKYGTPKTRTCIRARLNEDFTVEDFKTVIDIKHAEWANDRKWSKFLRPETLFGTKFEAYLNQRPTVRTSEEEIREWALQGKSSQVS